MTLKNKKKLVARILGIGKGRIVLNDMMKDELKEAITREDIRDLIRQGAIKIKQGKGRITKIRSRKRGFGKIRRNIKERKKEYMKITRRLRNYVKNLKVKGKITRELYHNLRKRIKAREFKSLAHLTENTKELKS